VSALAEAPRRRLSPIAVLVLAILLPGAGYIAIGQPRRGMTLQMFMIALAIVTWHLTTPAQSLIGRLSGGLFVYALSLPECYRLAKLHFGRRGESKDRASIR
jgi:hypothetical protein